MLRPARRAEQDGAGALYEEHAQIASSALRDAAKDDAITGRPLLRHQAKPCGKVPPLPHMALGRVDISRLPGRSATGRQTNFPPADVVPVRFFPKSQLVIK